MVLKANIKEFIALEHFQGHSIHKLSEEINEPLNWVKRLKLGSAEPQKNMYNTPLPLRLRKLHGWGGSE